MSNFSKKYTVLFLACLYLDACGGGSSKDLPSALATPGESTDITEEASAIEDSSEENNADNAYCEEITPGADFSEDYICAHNAIRASAQPAPSPSLAAASWDEDLAEIARAYAENCVYAHNSSRSDSYTGYVGENLFITTSNSATATTVVNAWASEAQFYSYVNNNCQPGEMCGHYTQIVWRDSTKIGCGTASCSNIEVQGAIWAEAHIVVCNYAPGGNYVGEKPY